MRGRNKNCDPKFTSRLVASNDHIFDNFPNKYSVTPSSVSSYRSKMACLSHQSSSMSKPPCNCDMAKGLKQPPLRTGFSLASTGHAGWPQPTRSSFLHVSYDLSTGPWKPKKHLCPSNSRMSRRTVASIQM